MVVFGFRMCQDVRLEIGRLSKLFIAAIERTDVRAVPGVNSYVRAEVKVQGEAFPTALESALGKRDNQKIELSITHIFHGIDRSL